jgi:hypothetical protein
MTTKDTKINWRSAKKKHLLKDSSPTHLSSLLRHRASQKRQSRHKNLEKYISQKDPEDKTKISMQLGRLGTNFAYSNPVRMQDIDSKIRLVTHIIKPMARPKHAPIPIVGRKIPAGIFVSRLVEHEERGMTLKSPTIMPKVHEVRTTLRTAVRINRKTFSRVAVGLVNY